MNEQHVSVLQEKRSSKRRRKPSASGEALDLHTGIGVVPQSSDPTPETEVGSALPRAHLLLTLLSISKSTRALTGLKLAKMGFHSGQDELLLALDEAKPITVSKIAAELCVRASTVSKTLDLLVEKGLVSRHSDRLDARRTLIGITPQGIEAGQRLLAMRLDLETDLVAGWMEDREEIAQSLETVAHVLSTRLKRRR